MEVKTPKNIEQKSRCIIAARVCCGTIEPAKMVNYWLQSGTALCVGLLRGVQLARIFYFGRGQA
jgi:hypothetical protein